VNVIPAGQEKEALSPLPVSVLDLAAEHADTFVHWGIHTLGMLAELPEKELIARMGQEGKRLRQIARGELPHFFQPIEPAFTLEEHLELDTPVGLLDSLLFVTNVLLEQLILRAASRVMALASVTITLFLEGGNSHSRIVRPALPTNDRQLWIKLLHLDMEAHPPQASVLALSLAAEPGCTSKVQLGLFNPQLPEPTRLDVTLARIAKIVGEECVGRAVLSDTHQREVFRVERFTIPASDPIESHPKRAHVTIRELRPPENISITLRSERPDRFQFRKQQFVVERAYGPWRTSGNWWNVDHWNLDQWDIVARAQDGMLLCCCLVCNRVRNRWQIVGLYD
jgi:protein ImuB